MLLFFRVAKLQRPAVCVCGGGVFAYPELKRAAGGDSSAVGGFVCRAFTTEAQRAGAYTRVRCFSFFAFTSSPDGRKLLSNSILRVKVSVKILHPLELTMEIQILHP